MRTSPVVYVLATTPLGTAQALDEASRRARDNGARIALLIPHVLSLDEHAVDASSDPLTRMDEFTAIASKAGVPVTSYVCVCRNPRDLAAWFELESSTIVVGGQRGPWWRPTPERLLARALTRQRHQVVFVDANP